jgi:hypothetical protein
MKFTSGGAATDNVYFDEENRRHLLSIRSVFAEAAGNMADQNRKPEALQLLQKSESLLNTEVMPYAMTSRYNMHNQTALVYLEAAFKAGDQQLANKVKTNLRKDLMDQRAYYEYIRNEKEDFYPGIQREAEINEILIRIFDELERKYTQQQAPVNELPQQSNAADTTR